MTSVFNNYGIGNKVTYSNPLLNEIFIVYMYMYVVLTLMVM